MTENEAIRDLQYLIEEYSAYPPETGVNATVGSLQYCISALKEIQQYREIGTVEECREAVEKQKPKVPEFTHMLGEYTGKFKCPICEQSFSYDCTDAKVFFCKKCGQALQMESEDD